MLHFTILTRGNGMIMIAFGRKSGCDITCMYSVYPPEFIDKITKHQLENNFLIDRIHIITI